MQGDVLSVRVAVRVRPLSQQEAAASSHVCIKSTPGEPQVVVGSDNYFTFDYVFPMDSTQSQIYDDCVSPLVEAAFEGFNATILAYGQTGSGKTYTMGSSTNFRIADEEQGIIPRVISNMFEMIDSRERENPNVTYTVKVQFLEIYGESIKDLLSSTPESLVTIRETSNGEVYVAGAREQTVASAEEMMMALEQGSMGRTVGSTLMNAQSSRSHAIFTIMLEQRISVGVNAQSANGGDATEDGATVVPDGPEVSLVAGEPEVRKSKFHFVDLAGSERAKRTGAEGQRLKEGIDINQGLLVLGNVISALGDEKRRGKVHVPYRDSKLTRMLQDSLGGNSRTLMICCVSPADSNLNESLNAVRYANRARNIQNKPVVNRDANSALIGELRRQLQLLATELLRVRSEGNAGGDNSATSREMLQMLATQNLGSTTAGSALAGNAAMTIKSNANAAELTKLQDEISLLRSQLTDSDYEVQRLTDQLKRVRGEQSTTVEQVSVLTAERDFFRFKWSEACPAEAAELQAHQSTPVDGVTVVDIASADAKELPEQLVIVSPETERAMAGEEGVGRQKESFVAVIQAYEIKLRELQDKLSESELARKLHAPPRTWSPGGFSAGLAPEDSEMEVDMAETFAKVIVRAQRQIKEDEKRLKAFGQKGSNSGDIDDLLSSADDDDGAEDEGDGEDIEKLNVVYKRRQKDLSSQVSHLTDGIHMKEQLVQQLLLSQQKYQSMVASFQQRLQEAAEEIARSEQERQKLAAELEELEHRQRQEPERPQTDNDRRRQAELQTRLKAKDEQLVALRKREQQLQQHSKLKQKAAEQLNAVKSEITEMKRQKIELTKKIDQERRAHMKALGQRAKEIEKLRRDLAKTKNEVQRLGNQTEKLERLAKRRAEEANIHRRRVNELAKVSNVQSTASSAVRKAMNQRSQRRPLNEAELKLRGWIEKRTRELSVRETQLDELRSQYEKRTKLLSKKQELERSRDRLTMKLHTNQDAQVQEELELELHEVNDRVEEIEQRINFESQRIQEMEQQFTQEDNCNVDRVVDQLKQHIRTVADGHMVIRQLFDMLMQSRKTATQRKQRLLAADAQAKSLTEQVEDLQSRIEADRHRYDRKLAQVQFEHEEKINALIDHTSAQSFGGVLFADGDDVVQPEDLGSDMFIPRRSFSNSPFKGSSMDDMSADQLRNMLTLSNERTSFLKKQVERLQAELDSRTHFVDELETNRRQAHLELLERKRDIEFLEAENATMREIIAEYKERVKALSGGEAINRQVRIATRHRRDNSELPSAFSGEFSSPSWKTNPLFEGDDNDEDSDSESVLQRFDEITEEVNRFGSVGRHPNEQEANYSSVFDKLTNPDTFTGIHKAQMEDHKSKRAKAKAIKKEVDNTRTSMRMKKIAILPNFPPGSDSSVQSQGPRSQSPVDLAKVEERATNDVVSESDVQLVDVDAVESDALDTPSPVGDTAEVLDEADEERGSEAGIDEENNAKLEPVTPPADDNPESKPASGMEPKQRTDVFARLASTVTQAELSKRQDKENSQKGLFSSFRRKDRNT